MAPLKRGISKREISFAHFKVPLSLRGHKACITCVCVFDRVSRMQHPSRHSSRGGYVGCNNRDSIWQLSSTSRLTLHFSFGLVIGIISAMTFFLFIWNPRSHSIFQEAITLLGRVLHKNLLQRKMERISTWVYGSNFWGKVQDEKKSSSFIHASFHQSQFQRG